MSVKALNLVSPRAHLRKTAPAGSATPDILNGLPRVWQLQTAFADERADQKGNTVTPETLSDLVFWLQVHGMRIEFRSAALAMECRLWAEPSVRFE